MSYTITHAKVTSGATDDAVEVDLGDWNDNHVISGSVDASEITAGAALTKTDDTNVTLTLGGTPTTALLKATSITVGWNSTLAVTRGGLGFGTTTQGDILYADASNSLAKLAKDTNATRYLSNTGTSNNPAWAQVALSTGISGFGTGIATALGVNVGSAGAPVLFNGALGTPSSGTVTNLTGTASININGTVGATSQNTGQFTSVAYSTTLTGTSTNASALAVGRQGATDPVLKVDASIASQACGLQIQGGATGNGTALTVIDSGTNSPLSINAKGSGTIALGNTSTGAVSVAKVTITAPASSATLTIPDGVTLTGPASSGTAMTLGNTETVTGVKTFGSAGAVGRFKLAGTTSGTTVLDATAVASGTLTLPAATDTLVGKATTDTLTNKTLDSAGTGNTLQVSSVTVSRGQYPAFNTNSSATAGNWFEYTESVIASGSSVAATTSTPSNVTSISLGAGNWLVWGTVIQNPAATTSFTANGFSISTTSATLDGTYVQFDRFAAFVPANPFGGFGMTRRLSLSGTTTVYLVQQCTFTVSTTGGYGYLCAIRI